MSGKVLIAFDDSANALRAVEFVAKSFSRDRQVTLFSTIPDTAAICDMNSPSLVPYFKSQQTAFCSLEDKKRALVAEAMEKAKQLLVEAGFAADSVTTRIDVAKQGAAKDIVNAADAGYDTIVMGRRGMSAVKEFILGSVSQKVLHLAQDKSVVLVD